MNPQPNVLNANDETSSTLAAQLKYHNDDGVVVRFDTDMLRKKCLQTSPDYLSSIDLDELVQDIFCVGEYWENRKLLFSSLISFGQIQGFKPTQNSHRLTCSRSGTKNYVRGYRSGGLMCNCSFSLTLKAMHNPITAPKNHDESSERAKPRPDFSRETKISKACYNHTGGCQPSAQNLIAVKQRGGDYKGSISSIDKKEMPRLITNLSIPLSNPSLDVTGRIFLITGGTQGLGLEIASQLKRNGAAAIVLVSRSPDKMKSVMDHLNGESDDGKNDVEDASQCIVKFVQADVSDASDASSIVPRAIQLLSEESSLSQPISISGVVNAAATTTRGNLLSTTADMFDGQFATNVRGPFLVTQGAARHMIERNVPRGVGSIVNICSVAAKGGAPFILGYSCAKSALVTLTKNNAAELAPKGIRVNGVNMGWTLTENEHRLQSKLHKNEEWWKKADASVPLGRILRPADVAATVLFLLSGASVMMTGSIMDLHPEYPCGMLSLSAKESPDR